MKNSIFIKAASLLAPFVPTALAQDTFTHAKSGITFWRQTIGTDQTSGGLEWGFALPGQPTGANDEYIGYIKGSLTSGQGWAGLSHGGAMPNALLLVAWAEGSSIKTSFNFAGGYVAPDPYTGNATLTQINATVTDTNFELVYRCQECWRWNQNGAEGSNIPAEVSVLGWATHLKNPEAQWVVHEKQGNFGLPVSSARNAKYAQWVADIKPPPPPGSSTPVASPTPTPTTPKCNGTPAPTESYDYIVVGGGAGGIPVADKLSESGKSVLLIERGPPSLARFGGNMGPEWALSNNLTRFDIPGLCNQIWVDSAGVACTDVDQMAGCVLGGGAAVNAALWWKPVDADFDVNFPNGWKSSDIKPAVDRVFKRIPGTDTPSQDGKRYKQEGFDILSGALSADGWKQVTANDQPNAKNRNFAHSPFMYVNAQRQGPLGAYLPTALARNNFKLLMGTMARRVVRTGGKATGVELESGYCGTVNLKPGGRVILSAGTFGTSKLLFRSGIGPKDQLTVVKNSAVDGSTMIAESSWINLPVGQNLNDHVNTDLVVRHPNISFYNFYKAWDTPIEADKNLYLNKRSGILATSAPNIGPLAWEVVKGSDGKERSIQWTARVEGPGENDTHHLTISQYLGRGTTSRGVLSINGALSMFVSQAPYLRNDGDTSAVIAGIKSMMTAIKKNPKIEFQVPPANQSVEDYVASLPKTPNARRANHWIGTAKIGTDSGLNGGTSVVDLNTKVYGTDNIHVVDASIFPGHIVTNPTGPIVVVAEHAAAKILALGASNGGTQSSSVKASSTVVPSSVKPTTPTPTATVPGWSQCGGQGYTGPTACASGFKCAVNNQWFSQCIPV